ncbi:riboflavin synthase subunit alpha [Motilimonas pumila]|uniref:Riboflavin synthase n=1 Tax=Motilimonas pumila TaxID=2303987 RepID=A0A418Y9X6_9GAMM|nr:riboflavin synthase subunit alpha [Motilimonas pumila]RJG38597.1 riboflavin synthase subunit alpha [Motilimonas pumila]
MFTGIVQGIGRVVEIDKKQGLHSIVIQLPEQLTKEITIGASIANNGTCLTVTKQDNYNVYFDVMEETLRLTNLGELKIGDSVNIERAAKYGDEIGGHVTSGHIHAMMELVEIKQNPNNTAMRLAFDAQWHKFILPKGFIAVDGISLTVGEVSAQDFWVHLIPETLQATTLGQKKLGDKLNMEIDPQTQAIVTTVERVLAQQHQA